MEPAKNVNVDTDTVDEYACSPEYSPSSPSYQTPRDPPVISLKHDRHVLSDAVTVAQNMIQNEPGGILLSNLLLSCEDKEGNTTFLNDLMSIDGIDIVCYPSPPKIDSCIMSVSNMLKTYRNNEAPVYDVRKQFPRITDSVWEQVRQSVNFRIVYYGNKQYINMSTRRQPYRYDANRDRKRRK